MFGDVVTVADMLLISLFSMFIVCLVLLLISYMIDFCAWILRRPEIKKAAAERQETKESLAGVSASQKSGANTETAAQSRCNTVTIAAAIAAYMMLDSDSIVVRRVTRVQDRDSAWAKNAQQEFMQ